MCCGSILSLSGMASTTTLPSSVLTSTCRRRKSSSSPICARSMSTAIGKPRAATCGTRYHSECRPHEIDNGLVSPSAQEPACCYYGRYGPGRGSRLRNRHRGCGIECPLHKELLHHVSSRLNQALRNGAPRP